MRSTLLPTIVPPLLADHPTPFTFHHCGVVSSFAAAAAAATVSSSSSCVAYTPAARCPRSTGRRRLPLQMSARGRRRAASLSKATVDIRTGRTFDGRCAISGPQRFHHSLVRSSNALVKERKTFGDERNEIAPVQISSTKGCSPPTDVCMYELWLVY